MGVWRENESINDTRSRAWHSRSRRRVAGQAYIRCTCVLGAKPSTLEELYLGPRQVQRNRMFRSQEGTAAVETPVHRDPRHEHCRGPNTSPPLPNFNSPQRCTHITHSLPIDLGVRPVRHSCLVLDRSMQMHSFFESIGVEIPQPAVDRIATTVST